MEKAKLIKIAIIIGILITAFMYYLVNNTYEEVSISNVTVENNVI